MGNKRRKRKNPEPLSSPTSVRGRSVLADSDNRGAAGASGGPGGGAEGASIKTHAITRLPDGTVCIGSECVMVRIPPKGDVEIDLTDCDDEVKERVAGALIKGAGADFKVGKK